ncbi:MAG TPA: proprotein convertase P-domain-containing protein [Acidobacteriota bacterium]|nr:proprotein convertase P-domain-containing protein [Acidobacteriota bacterium]
MTRLLVPIAMATALVLVLGLPALGAQQTYTSTPNLFVPDALPPGPGTPVPVTDTINVPDFGTITDINVTLTLQHPQTADVTIDLTDPTGTVTVRLFDRKAGVGDGLYNVTFDDSAAGPPPDFTVNGTCQVNNSFQVAMGMSLADFNGLEINGDWTLTIADAGFSDASDCDCDGFVVGPACPRTLDEWSMEITFDPLVETDLEITKTDSLDVVNPGGSLVYEIEASNNGPNDVTGATVSDSFPPDLLCTWNCVPAGGASCTANGTGNISESVDIPNGDSVVFMAACDVFSGAAGTLSNTATVTAPAGVTDTDASNDSATDETAVNQAPVALCQDVEVEADGMCQGDASASDVDNGSFDPDGDSITLGLSPAGPYSLGDTSVTLTVEDSLGLSSTCSATVTVVDVTPPEIQCNTPVTIIPPDAPISFTASVTDACDAGVTATVTGFECFFINGSGRRVDKGESCVVSFSGSTLTVHDSGGVGDQIEWQVTATDASGNVSTETCSVSVVNPN